MFQVPSAFGVVRNPFEATNLLSDVAFVDYRTYGTALDIARSKIGWSIGQSARYSAGKHLVRLLPLAFVFTIPSEPYQLFFKIQTALGSPRCVTDSVTLVVRSMSADMSTCRILLIRFDSLLVLMATLALPGGRGNTYANYHSSSSDLALDE